MDLEFNGTRHEFHIVGNQFPIAEDGILSANFFQSEKAVISLKDKYLNSRNTGRLQLITGEPGTNDQTRILTTAVVQTPKIDMQAPELTKRDTTLLIDTGADINILKIGAVKPEIPYDSTDKLKISGITHGIIETIGSLNIEINNKMHKFHLVETPFPIKEDGILGAEFLYDESATISFEANQLILGNSKVLPLKNENLIKIPPRTSQVIPIEISNPAVKVGYIDAIDLGPNIFFGKSLVTNIDGIAYAYAINSNESAVEINRPVATLEEVSELADPNPTPSQLSRNKRTSHTHSRNHLNDEDTRILCISTNYDAKRLDILKENLRLDHLNEEEKQSIIDLTTQYNHLFFLPGDDLGHTHLVSHTIPTSDNIPTHTKQYRYPQVHRNEIQKQVNKLLDQDIIQHSTSPYNSPVWIVPKKTDASGKKKWRMVIDFRKLNEKTVGDAYPLPNITDILDRLGSAKYFSTFDLASGFHQIPMDPNHSCKTAFSTPHGHFEYKRMPFGLKNAPSTFQRLMDQVLSGLQGNEIFVYLDDIVIYASSLEEHAIKFKNLMDRLTYAGLTLQPDKCEFLRTEVAYLGHIITQEGIKPNPDKIAAIKNYPVPKNSKQIKQLLGLIGYYRRFIPNLSKIEQPINNLLKKNTPFVWTSEHQFAFETLRDSLCNEPILQYPNFEKPFILTTNASNLAIGAVLSQGKIGEDLPIAYASRSLQKAEINYSTTDKELLAIVFAVKHFRPYLYGRKFTLATNHSPLIWINNIKDPTSRMLKWRLTLDEYSYDVVYKKGGPHKNAAALASNLPEDTIQILPINSKRQRSETDTQSGEINKRSKEVHHFPTRPRRSTDESGNPAPLKRHREFDKHAVPKLGNLSSSSLPSSDSDGEAIPQATRKPKRCHSTGSSSNPAPKKIPNLIEQASSNNFTDSSTLETVGSGGNAATQPFDSEWEHEPSEPNTNRPSRYEERPNLTKPTDHHIKEQESSSGDTQRSGNHTIKYTLIRGQLNDTRLGTNDTAHHSKSPPGYTPPYSQFLKDLDFLPLSENKFTREINANLLKQKDNLAHCISADCATSQGLAHQMVTKGLIRRKLLRGVKAEVTDVISVRYPRRIIYNLVTKQRCFEKPSRKSMYDTLVTLKSAIVKDNVKSISIPRLGCGLDQLSWDMVKRMIHYIFKDMETMGTICTYNMIYDSGSESTIQSGPSATGLLPSSQPTTQTFAKPTPSSQPLFVRPKTPPARVLSRNLVPPQTAPEITTPNPLIIEYNQQQKNIPNPETPVTVASDHMNDPVTVDSGKTDINHDFDHFIDNLNNILGIENVTETNNGLLMTKDNYAHFTTADSTWSERLEEELVDKGLIDKITFRDQKPHKREIFVSKLKNKHTFSLVVKNNRFDKSQLDEIFHTLVNLKNILLRRGLRSIRLPTTGAGIDDFQRPIIKKLVYYIFANSNIRVIFCLNTITVPAIRQRADIIKEYHESLLGGHQGIAKTYYRIRQRYFWPHLKTEIQSFIKSCDSCQRKKLVRNKTRLPMIITDTPGNAFDKVALDIVGPLPITQSNNQYLLTLQCNLTKFLDAIPIPDSTAQTIGTVFAREYITRYGAPRAILTDQGANFMSTTMKQISRLFKIKQIRTSAYRPQSNGSLERSHIVLTEFLKHYTDAGKNWDEYIRFAIFCYNTAKHEGTNFTPHQLIFGAEAQLPSNLPPAIASSKTYPAFVLDLIANLREIRKRAADNINKSKERSKLIYDKRINTQNFEPGQRVFLVNEPRSKFSDHYKGPYVIKKIINNINAEIRITPNKTKIVHLNKLKLAHTREQEYVEEN